jgi:hypothetical protein
LFNEQTGTSICIQIDQKPITCSLQPMSVIGFWIRINDDVQTHTRVRVGFFMSINKDNGYLRFIKLIYKVTGYGLLIDSVYFIPIYIFLIKITV